ncbi:MAG: protein translocase subunit SecDF [Chitinophagaceae bacterium]|jgi:SecD/SecF fusion protein|nr:protein translocase subunit SecDF [Chitinophagaceae bacterium]
MQLKGLIKIFTIALILISLFQLSFTLVVNNFEKKQESKVRSQLKTSNPGMSEAELSLAADDKLRFVLDSLSTKEIYNLGITKYTYQEAKEEQLNLGLDLQGGMNVVLEVSLDDLVRSMSNNRNDPALNLALEEAKKMQVNSQEDFISLFAKAYEAKNPQAKLATMFVNSSSKDLNFNSSNADVLKKMKAEAKDAINRTHKVLLTRIDKFGVAQPNVNLDENRGIISVELAGVNNPERVRKYLQATAKLEFWETYSQHEIAQGFIKADEDLKALLSGKKENVDTSKLAADTNQVANTAAPSSSDTGSLASLMKTDTSKTDTSTAGMTDEQKIAKAKKDNPLRSFLLGGFEVRQDPKTGQVANMPMISYVFTRDTAQLREYLNMPVVKKNFPADCRFYFGIADKENREKNKVCILYSIKTNGKDAPPLGGDHITDTRQDYDRVSGQPDVQMSMDPVGARMWERLTGANVGKPIAIVLDDIVYSAPAPSEKIAGGSSNITGSFTVEEAQDLANILKTGKLPAPAKIVQEQVVGPTLGEEAVNGGMLSFIISFIVIFILMLVYYNTAGWVANIALILNLLFTVGVLAALHASLTAAGIAGLVLTIGMAVDTNVIIFERIKEELKLGKNHESAVNDGYRRSLNPVLDGHITVLMTAIILFIFGLGPVLGFATTQILGILLSLFCGILVSRLITDMRMSKGKHFNYFTGISEKMFQKFNFHFIEWRKKAYIISIVVLILGIAAIFNGFYYGVEFAGGRSYTVKLEKAVSTNDIREALKANFEEFPIVKTIGNANQVNITTAYKIKESGIGVESEVQNKLYEGLKKGGFIPSTVDETTFKVSHILSSQTVLPTISDDLKKGALWATFWSFFLIAVYIFVRFRKWQYSLGTIVALVHDVLVTLAVFSFLKGVVPFALEIDQHFIAAVLTVIGFSMNDTVIVFDRVREYFRKRAGDSKTNIINAAINDTMSRTIMTSLTVFLTLLILFIFGGEVTRGFAFAMMIGVITGTYSSIFVAAPILVDLDKSDNLINEEDKEKRIEELKKMA